MYTIISGSVNIQWRSYNHVLTCTSRNAYVSVSANLIIAYNPILLQRDEYYCHATCWCYKYLPCYAKLGD